MNIETSKVNTRKTTTNTQQTQQTMNDPSIKFTDELNGIKTPVTKEVEDKTFPSEKNIQEEMPITSQVQTEKKEVEQTNLTTSNLTTEIKRETPKIIKETEAINLLKETVESVKAELPENHNQTETQTQTGETKKIINKNPFIEEKINKETPATRQKNENNDTTKSENSTIADLPNTTDITTPIKNKETQQTKSIEEIIQPEINKEVSKEVNVPVQTKPIEGIDQPEVNKETSKEIETSKQIKPKEDNIKTEINKEVSKEGNIPAQTKPIEETIQPEKNKETAFPEQSQPQPKAQKSINTEIGKKIKKNIAKEQPKTEANIKKEIHTDIETKKTVIKENKPTPMQPEKEQEEKLKPLDNALNGLNTIVKELNKKSIINQSEEKVPKPIKTKETFADEEEKGNDLINNDINIQENKDIMPQMSSNMNFSGDGQPFSSFMNNEENNENQNGSILGNSAKDLAEEAAILSTMAENIAIANKNNMIKQQEKPVIQPVKEIEHSNAPTPKQTTKKPIIAKIQGADSKITQDVHQDIIEKPQIKTVVREEGVKKVDTKTGITIENVVKYDNIIMNQADVEVFANLVEQGEVDMKNLAPEAAKKAVEVSKSLADMLNKAMESKQPLRIDFDNNISVIIRISRDGKISAEFLPSSQIAEAYLKENLPMLRQRFDDNNIKYDDLSQRNNSRDKEKENNRRKGRNDE